MFDLDAFKLYIVSAKDEIIAERSFGAEGWVEAGLAYRQAVRTFPTQQVILYDMRLAQIAHEHKPAAPKAEPLLAASPSGVM